jgi:hypothetical protein
MNNGPGYMNLARTNSNATVPANPMKQSGEVRGTNDRLKNGGVSRPPGSGK